MIKQPQEPYDVSCEAIVGQLMVTSFRLVQPKKACASILVTLVGIFILVRLLQPKKALYPMLVTLFDISIFVRLVQLSKV